MSNDATNIDLCSDLDTFNKQINDYENRWGIEAEKFFADCLHDDLRFKGANDTWESKKEFLERFKKENAFERRSVEDIHIQQLKTGEYLVWCKVVAKKSKEENTYQYRNLRIFRLISGKWLLHVWYNYEMK